MPAAHAPGSVPLSADARLKEANRRKIYLHRLLGDEVSGSKDKGGKSVTWVAALFFAIYVFVASFVIIRRSSVEWRSEVWLGSVTGIYEQPFTLTPIFKYFDDIYTTDDVLDWATRFVWSIVALPGQLPLSLVGFNRLMPAESDEGAIYLTYRRMKLSDSSTDPATTRRFQPLYPNTWLASELKGGTATGDFEDTDLLVSGNFTWRYEPGAGYKRQGGYIAKMVLPTSGGFDKGYVQVNDQRMGFVDFREATWFGPTFGSMAVQMALYNPNYQSISRIDLVFNARETGLLAGKIVDSRSMLLDVYDPITDKADIAYLIFTCFSFFSSVIKAWKSNGDGDFLMDIWTYIDMLSVLFSLGALITWRVHVGRLQEFLNSDTAYKDIEEISSAIVFFSQVYCRVSAVATLLIYWRSLQLLSMYNFRLRRIGRSFALMAGKLLAYGCLMLVVFLGFFAFATALFGARYVEFHHEGIGLTTAMAMFFGDVTGVQHITDPLFKLFFGSFMIVFYIFSVQMFNAIINYAYNRVSEEMQDQFDRERRQADTKKARKELRRRLAGTRSLVTQCRRCLHRLVRPAAAKRKVGAAAGAEDASRSTEHKKSQPVLEHLDDEMREKVGKWLNGADGQHSTFKMGRVFMFFLYAITYFWFLRVNIIIPVNYEVHAALDSSIKPVAIEVPTWEENKIQYTTWDQLHRVSQVKTWMQEALPTVLFGDPPEERPPCLASWNCVIHLPSADASDRLVLLTAVRRPAAKNEGCLKSPCTDGRTPFLGGPSLVPFRQSPEAGGSSQACTEVFNVTGLPCSTSCTGGELKVQCFLEAEHSAFVSSMSSLSELDFFAYNTKSLRAEFAIFNGNYKVVSLVALHFDLMSSGRMKPSIDMDTMATFDLHGSAHEIVKTLAQRVLPGVLCVCFSIYFTTSLFRELNQAFIRKSMGEHEDGYESRLSITWGFFSGDPFNALELISFMISLAAAASFAVWLVRDLQLKGAVEGSLGDFLTLMRTMQFWHQMFNRLSGVNVIFLFIRPINFLRFGSVRIAQLWKTLADAQHDIFWFVVMMSVILVGLIMFAWMSFGERFRPCSSFGGAAVYCLDYLFGRFEFGLLYKSDAVMASLFFYQYLLVCYVVFSNTLFAIIDRYFVTNDPPHVNLKRKLKPFFGRLLRFIEWDNDHTMVQDPQVKMEEGPPSRAKRVRDFAQRIALIRETGNVNAEGPMPSNKKAKGLPEVCDVDERMQQVLSWSRDEARKTVNAWSMMALEKEACKNEDVFIETVMRGKGGSREGIEAEELNARKDMEDAFRHIRYAREVHETMAQRDQRTLAQYITALEQSIQEEMVQESALRHEVVYLRGEAEKMASAPEETLDTASAAEDAPSQQQLEEGPDGDVQDPQRDGGESEDSYDNW